MGTMKVSEFLKGEIAPIVLGAFYSRYCFTDDGKYIFAYTAFSKTTKKDIDVKVDFDKNIDSYLEALNDESKPFSCWIKWEEKPFDFNHRKIGSLIALYVLENDINLKKENFYKRLNYKILSSDWLYDNDLNEEKKSFIRGYMELRGSIDTKLGFITQDYFYTSIFEIKKGRTLVDYFNVPYEFMNINFRELQKQFREGVSKRNTQFRLRLRWYLAEIGLLNEYKMSLIEASTEKEGSLLGVIEKSGNIYYAPECYISESSTTRFSKMLDFFLKNVYQQTLSDVQVKKLREKLKFDSKNKSPRSAVLVDYIRKNTPDVCMGCCKKYDISDRSYKKENGKYYFEIHHVVSLGGNKELDDENNMVKLCPVCHKTLKRGSGAKEEQKRIISEIFYNEPKTFEFAKNLFDENDFEKVVEKTFEGLK